MAANSKIEWTTHTFNPVIGCARVSPGCENCYAEARSIRWGDAEWGPHGTRKVTSESNWRKVRVWNRQAFEAGVPGCDETIGVSVEEMRRRPRVFCASLSDVFEDHPTWEAPRARLRRLVQETPFLDWLILTKRPESAMRLWKRASEQAERPNEWPSNVWIGTTVEDQKRCARIEHLLTVPARVHFLSCEPLLGPIDFGDKLHLIDWVILGGESGTGARALHLEWIRSIRDQARAEGCAVHMKQLGAHPHAIDEGGLISPLRLVDRGKGGDWSEWPDDLKIREYPTPRSIR